MGARAAAPKLAGEAATLARALARRGFTEGRGLALLLPNTPTLLIAFSAACQLGLRLLLVDPREAEARLRARLREFSPDILMTSDPTPLFDKTLRLLAHCPPDIPVVVERFTDLLPFPRNLLAPLLRGGAIATLPPEPRFLRYGDFVRSTGKMAPLPSSTPQSVTLLEGSVEPGTLLRKVVCAAGPKRPKERWLVAAPLGKAATLARVLRGLYDGAELVLSPRLDRRSLTKLGRQAAIDVEIA